MKQIYCPYCGNKVKLKEITEAPKDKDKKAKVGYGKEARALVLAYARKEDP